MDQSLVSSVNALQSLKKSRFNSFTGRVCQALPEVGIVSLIDQVLCIRCLSAHIPAKDNCSETLGLDRDCGLIWVKTCRKKQGVLVRLLALSDVQLTLSGLSCLVIV